MGFNRFYFSVFINSALIFLLAFLCFFFINTRQQYTTASGIAILALFLLGRLVFHVNRTNRILDNFLMYLQDEDPSLSYTIRYTDKNFRGLNERLGELLREFKENRIELEIQAQYLEAILGNLSTGILSFNESGEVRTMNKSAGNYLGLRKIRHVRELEKKTPGLGTRMMAMQPGDQVTIKTSIKGRTRQLSVNSAQIKIKNEIIHIISLIDISNQMEEQEIESWKKLIRVINHEIMNSMTPIITLTLAIRKKLMMGKRVKLAGQVASEDIEDAVQSAAIIEGRSRGLVNFIDRYRKITGLPPLNPDTFPVGDLFLKIEKLYGEEFRNRGIRFHCQADCSYELKADRQMLEQVLINLLKNSFEALENIEKPEIRLSCTPDTGKGLSLIIADNGEGIPSDKLEQVFVPFFSTREDGTGIGLSLCKQIMRLHNGTINIESNPTKGTRVLLNF